MAQTKFPVRRSRPRSALGALRVSQQVKARNIIVVDVYPCYSESQSDVAVGSGPVLVYSKKNEGNIGERIQSLARNKRLSLQHAPDHTSSVLNPFATSGKDFVGLYLPVKYAQTPSEIVDLRDIEALHALLTSLMEEGRI